jgi:type IV fimbrial biogenesis protein FimT
MQLSRGLPHLTRIKRNLGVTLLEVIIVILVITITTLVAVPSFITFLQEHRLTMTADTLFAAMQYARSEAIKRNTTVYVSFQTGDNWCYGINTGSSCTCSNAASCNLGATQAPQAQQISVSTTALASNSFQFEGSRGASNVSNGLVTFTIYGQTTSISLLIGQIGDLQLCSALSGYQACP